MIRNILVISLSIILFGCNDSDSSNTTTNSSPSEGSQTDNPIEQLEASGAIPKLERGSEIKGTDNNSNGIRDDVESYISSNFSTPNQVAAATQYAQSMQEALSVDLDNPIAVKEANRNISRADHCIYSTFDENSSKQAAQVSQELEAISTNTKERLLAYLAFSKALDGTSWAIPEGDTCE